MLKNTVELIFTEDSHYRLAGYESVLQDVADMIHFPLRCGEKPCVVRPPKPFLLCYAAGPLSSCREPLLPWLLVLPGSSLVLASPSNISSRLSVSVGAVRRLSLSSQVQGSTVCFRFQKLEATIRHPAVPLRIVPCFD